MIRRARVISPVATPARAAAKIAWVPVSSRASRRSWGKPLTPRGDDGRPTSRSSAGRSGTSIVVPSKLTSRSSRYHAPGAPGSASDPAEQFAQRRFAQAHAGLGDGRLARQSHRRAAASAGPRPVRAAPRHTRRGHRASEPSRNRRRGAAAVDARASSNARCRAEPHPPDRPARPAPEHPASRAHKADGLRQDGNSSDP
jgi:hypothetical protein